MTVKTVLSLKSGDVATIAPTASLATAAKVLAERRIGALVVMDAADRVAGILSERDIMRALAERGAAALDERLDRAMTRSVVTCTEATTVSEIMRRMTAGKFRHLPVVEFGRLVGIVSIGDVVKYRLAAMQHESQSMREYVLTA
jgi:CBS domain-containing protein